MKSFLNKYNNIPKSVKASFWFLICSFLQKGISLITTPIFTRILSTAEYGQFSVFNSWLNMVTVFVTLNMCLGMYTRGLVINSEDRDRFSSSLQGLCLVLVFFWTVVYLFFADEINKLTSLSTVQMLAMLFLIWTNAAFQFWATEQKVLLKYRTLVWITVIASIAKPLLGIILVYNAEDKVTARILGLAIINLMMYSGCFIAQMKRGRVFCSKKYWKNALWTNIPLIPHYLSSSVLNGADKIMIERMVGAAEAGIYGLAYSLSQIMLMFNTALTQTIEPWLYKQIKNKELDQLGNVAYPAWILIAFLNILLIALAPEIVSIFAPKAYHDAIWIIPPVSMSVYFMFLYVFFAVFEFYYLKTKLVALATCAGAVLNIVLNYVFIGRFGYYAAGYTTLACYVMYALMHYLFMRKICKKELHTKTVYNNKVLIGISSLFVVAGCVLMMTYNYFVLRYFIILGALVCLLLFRKKVIIQVRKILSIKGAK